MLEAAQYEDNAFVTLTYDDEHLPVDLSVNPRDTQAWLKRLRARIAPLKLRFFLVGEYGDTSERPHYHVALFGYKSCHFGQSRYSKLRRECCAACELVRETWQQGNVYLGSLEADSAGYMAGYVTKKMTHKDDARLKGRHPEFGRMSLRPGIGYSALWEIADALLKYEIGEVDVPQGLRHGSKELPLGRYLRRKLRLMVGKDEKISQEAFDALCAEMLSMRESARSDNENPSIKARVIEAGNARVRQMEGKQRIYRARKVL